MKEELVQIVYGFGGNYEKSYTYRADLHLKVGDLVEVPPTSRTGFHGSDQIATVVALNSSYRGPTHKIIRKHKHGWVWTRKCHCGREKVAK